MLLASLIFNVTRLPFSEFRLFEGFGSKSDNATSTTSLIDMFEAEVDAIVNDASYHNYLRFLDR